MVPEWWRRFREFDKKGPLMDRVEGHMAFSKRGYVINRRIFQGYVVFILGLIAYLFLTSGVGWQEFYVHCPTQEEAVEGGLRYFGPWCENPCYLSAEDYCVDAGLTAMQMLPEGFSYGRPPSAEFQHRLNWLWVVIGCGFVFAFSVNHLLYNKGRPVSHLFPELEVDEK